jgi:hypothetical protein
VQYIPLADIAAELDVDLEDVTTVAFVEIANDMFDDDCEAVTPEGRDIIVTHFFGGEDPS